MTDLQLTATMPEDMARAQQDLIAWCERKLTSLQSDLTEARESIEHARTMHWKMGPFQRQETKLIKSIAFYEKLKVALEAGYVIVPNFPVQLFAIRTKGNPRSKFEYSFWGNKEQDTKALPIGEGEYRNPFPLVEREREAYQLPDGKTETTSWSRADNWDDLEFPITMMKPEIIEATNRAMTMRIFDQFGVLPSSRRKEDPMIIGQIVRVDSYYSRKIISFMIAWHLNTKDL